MGSIAGLRAAEPLLAEPVLAATLADKRTAGAMFGVLLVTMVALALFATRWRRPSTNMNNLEEWGVGGRAFGNWVTWFLIGGAAYTAYTVVALPAYAWGNGAMAFYAVPFALITTPLVFLVSTRFWSVSHAHGFVTMAEFARARFGSRPLALLVALTIIAATLPYLALQLIAFEAVFRVLGVDGEWPLIAALAVISIATFRGGLRAPALLSIAKDVLLVWLVLSAVLVVAMSGGWGKAFDAADLRFANDQNPASGVLLSGPGQWAYLTLIVGSALSIFAYPHTATALLAAKDRATIRRNSAALPVYCLVLGLMALLGIFAVGQNVFPVDADLAHGNPGTDYNTIAPMIFNDKFPAWSAGIAYATIAVAALIPAAIMSIGVANLFTRSIYMEYFRPRATAAEEARVSRWTSLFVKFAAAGVVLLLSPQFSVDLQTIGGIIVLQVLPAVFFGLMTGWFHRWSLIVGLVTGLAWSIYLLYHTPVLGPGGVVLREHFGGSMISLRRLGFDSDVQVYIGLVTLLANLAIVVLVTAVLKLFHVSPNLDHTRPEDYVVDADVEGIHRLDDLLDGVPQQTGAHALR
jgi:SSS family solute:Na+ symporter